MNVRNKLKKAIKRRLEDAGFPHVETTRMSPIEPETELPMILIYSINEKAEAQDDLETYHLNPMVEIAVCARGDSAIDLSADDEADAICQRIEDLLCKPMCDLLDEVDQPILQTLEYIETNIRPHDNTELNVIIASVKFRGLHLVDLADASS